MKPLYKKTRVVHDAPNDRYLVEINEGFFSGWEHEQSFRYWVEHREYYTLHHKPTDTQEQALEKAIAMAKALKTKTVVWEER